MSRGAIVFAALVFLLIGGSFVASTGALIFEFADKGRWLDFLAIDAHLFLFFPTLGIVALVAFFRPAAALVDLYWHHLSWGRLRFVAGLLVAGVSAWALAGMIGSSANKPMWEIPPAVLAADRPTDMRVALPQGIDNLRAVSKARNTIRPFIRKCSTDPLIARRVQVGPQRYCLAATPYDSDPALLEDDACCRAQSQFSRAIVGYRGAPDRLLSWSERMAEPLRILQRVSGPVNRSLTADMHVLLLPLKALFLILLIAISFFLTVHFQKLRSHYAAALPGIEAGVLIGTVAVLFFPMMAQAFILANEALVGESGFGFFSRLVPKLSLAFGFWTLAIMLFFFRGRNRETEVAGKILGAGLGIVTLVQYDAIVGFLMQTIGAGATVASLTVFVCISVVLLGVTYAMARRSTRPDWIVSSD